MRLSNYVHLTDKYVNGVLTRFYFEPDWRDSYFSSAGLISADEDSPPQDRMPTIVVGGHGGEGGFAEVLSGLCHELLEMLMVQMGFAYCKLIRYDNNTSAREFRFDHTEFQELVGRFTDTLNVVLPAYADEYRARFPEEADDGEEKEKVDKGRDQTPGRIDPKGEGGGENSEPVLQFAGAQCLDPNEAAVFICPDATWDEEEKRKVDVTNTLPQAAENSGDQASQEGATGAGASGHSAKGFCARLKRLGEKCR